MGQQVDEDVSQKETNEEIELQADNSSNHSNADILDNVPIVSEADDGTDGQNIIHEHTDDVVDIVDKDVVDDDVSEAVVDMFLDEIVESAVTAAAAASEEKTIDENSNQSIASDSTEFDGLVINEASADSSETVSNTKTSEGADKICTNAEAITTTQDNESETMVVADAPELAQNTNELIKTDVINENEAVTAAEVSVGLLNGDSDCSNSTSSSSSSTSNSSSRSSSPNRSPNSTETTTKIIHTINSRPAKRKLSTDSTNEYDIFAKQAKITEDDDTVQTNGNDFDVMHDNKSTSTALAIESTTTEENLETNNKFTLDNHFMSSPIVERPVESLESNVNVNEKRDEMVDATNIVTKDVANVEAKHVNGFVDGTSVQEIQSSVMPQINTTSTIEQRQQNTAEMKQHLKQQLLFGAFSEGVVSNYAQCLGLQPMVKFKCFKCEANDFTTLAELKNHHLVCLRNANNNLDKSMEIDTINGKTNSKQQQLQQEQSQQRIATAVATVADSNVQKEGRASFFHSFHMVEPSTESTLSQLFPPPTTTAKTLTAPTTTSMMPNNQCDLTRTISSIDTKQSNV